MKHKISYNLLWIVFTVIFLGGSVFGQIKDLPDYHTVEVQLSDADEWSTLRQFGFDFESAHRVTKNSLRLIIRDDRLKLLDENDLGYAIIQRDMGKFYAQRAKEARRVEPPEGFGYGSLAGFYTFDEMVAKLDTLHIQFPDIISEKTSIGTTAEGRDLWAVKISDNYQADESEPEVLYTGLHHAREPVSMMSVLYYMYWLTTNYASNSEAAYLVNERELWFVPCINPDGYVYNQDIYEDNDGQTVGMWRKNKRDNNTNGSFDEYYDGVDLNRNYGNHWAYNDSGSSGDPWDATYRGEAAFSELETSAVRDFVLSRSFRAALNYHTYSDLMIYPFGYASNTYPPQPDYSIFKDFSQRMTDYNGYHQGAGPDILYVTNGDSDDWMYDGIANQNIFAMTPEVGGSNDGFWPSPDRLFPLVEETLHQNKFLSFAVGAFPQPDIISVESPGEYPEPGDEITIQIPIVNRGLESTPPNFQVEITVLGNALSFSDSTFDVGEIIGRGSDTLAFQTTVRPYTLNGQRNRLKVHFSDDNYLHADTLEFRLGTPLFSDDAESGMVNWNADQWGIANQSYNASNSFTDSPDGSYSNSAEEYMVLNRSLDFSGISDPELQFRMYCAIEADWDLAQVQVSTDSAEWASVAGEYTRTGSGAGVQSQGDFGYDGYRGWVYERMDLSDYAGEENVYLRFMLNSDTYVNGDGVFIDDITVYGTSQSDGPLIYAEPESFGFEIPFGGWEEAQLTLANQGSGTLQYTIRENSTTGENAQLTTLPRGDGLEGLTRVLTKQSVQTELQSVFQDDPDGLQRDPGATASEVVIQDTVGDYFGEDSGIIVPDIQSVTVETDTILTGQRTMIDISFSSPVTDTIIGLVSLDVDQNHATGSYPAALGLLPPNVSIGAEYEVILLPQGLQFSGNSIIDTTINIPAGSAVVMDMSDTTIAGIGASAMPQPDLLQVTLLPVFSAPGMDGSRFNLAVACLAGSVSDTSLAGIPDFAPNIGHGTYGEEQGASWLAAAPLSGAIPPDGQNLIRLPVVASANQDVLSASLTVLSNSVQQDSLTIPVDLSVLPAPEPQMSVNRTSVSDTLVPGYQISSTLELSNTGDGMLSYFIADTSRPDWYDVTPRAGAINAGESQSVQLIYSPDSTEDGVHYSGNMFVASTSVTGNLLDIPVELVIGYSEVAQRGDVNRDAQILSDDLQLLSSLILAPGTPTPYQYWAGDINRDGQLNVKDIIVLLNTLASD